MTTTAIPSLDVNDFKSNIQNFDRMANGTGTYADRFGRSRLTLDAFMAANGFEVPVAFASGIAVSRTTQTVTYEGNTYHALPSALPFTTTGTFNAAQWALLRQNADNVTSATLTITGFTASAALDGAWIHFAGRDTVGDGGGGMFRYSASSTLAADGGFVFAPTGGGRLFREGWTVLGFNGPANVRWFGAKVDGSTVDTVAVQAAIDSASSVYFPEGVCLVGVVNLRSNIELFGMGKNSILKQGDGVPGGRGSLYANSNSATLQLENITIRDLQVLGQVATKGFSEFVHLISLNGVKNVLLNRVYCTGFQGDGLYLGSGLVGEERHNRDIMVINCQFDGVNNQNRNGISVIDVDGLTILSPRFFNVSAPSMPGCIDMEPDGNAFAILRNILIKDVETTSCGGNVGHVALYSRTAVLAGAAYPLNISIDGVSVKSPKTSQGIPVCIITGIDHTDYTEVNDIKIRNITAYGGTIPYDVRGCKKLLIEDSTFVDFTNSALLGYSGSGGANYNVTHRGNTYVRCGKISANTGTSVFDIRWLHSRDNVYRDCGTSGGSSGIAMNFDVGMSSGVTLENETYLSTVTMLIAVGKEASHTFNPATNRFVGNNRGALRSYFQAYLTDDTAQSVNVYDGNTLPTAFPMGVSISLVNGAAGIPSGYGQGILKTERYTNDSGYPDWITQYFIPRYTTAGSLVEMYWRKSTSSDAGWSSWVKVTAS